MNKITFTGNINFKLNKKTKQKKKKNMYQGKIFPKSNKTLENYRSNFLKNFYAPFDKLTDRKN